MRKMLEHDVEVQRLDGSVAGVKMVWPPALTKGQRVNVPVNDRDWTKAEVIEVVKEVCELDTEKHKVIVREIPRIDQSIKTAKSSRAAVELDDNLLAGGDLKPLPAGRGFVSSQTCAAAWIVLKSVNSSPCRKFNSLVATICSIRPLAWSGSSMSSCRP
jgi:hypothetical protein